MDPNKVTITHHAWLRFKQRWEGETPECFYTEIRRLLNIAVPEDIGIGSVVRLINNGFQPAVYYQTHGWRFVLDEQELRLLTCERMYLRGRKKKSKLYNRKRYGG